MENINYESLEKLGIFEVRNIAREVGIYSPTTLKKQELVEKIIDVISGKEKPYLKTTKQGRPPKNITTLNDLMGVIIPPQLLDNKKEFTTKNSFNDFNETIDCNTLGTNESCFQSFIKVYDDYALAFYKNIREDKDNVVFINRNQVSYYNLRSGDKISGKSVFISNDKPLILKELYSINDVSFTSDSVRNCEFNQLPAIISNQKLPLSIYKNDEEMFKEIDLFNPLAKGQRILLSSDFNNDFVFNVISRLTTANNNLKGLAVLIDEIPENYYVMLANSKIEVISNNYNQKEDLILKVDVKTNNLLRCVEDGEDVLFYVNDISKLYNYFINHFVLEKFSLEEAKVKAKQHLVNTILLGKNTERGSLTVIFGNNETRNFDIEDYECLFNNKIYYKKENLKLTLDKKKSMTKFIDKILSKSEYSKYCELMKNSD